MKLLATIAMIFISILAIACAPNKPSSSKALEDQKIICPSPSRLEYAPWGKSGLMATCKTDHGPFVAAENGRVVLTGQYAHGKETGEWRWYNDKGEVDRKEFK